MRRVGEREGERGGGVVARVTAAAARAASMPPPSSLPRHHHHHGCGCGSWYVPRSRRKRALPGANDSRGEREPRASGPDPYLVAP